MSEKRFKYGRAFPINSDDSLPCITDRQDEKDYVRMSDLVELLNEQQSTIQRFEEYINKLQEEIAFWKKWALEYLTNYDIYTDEFLEILEFIEGEETVQRIRERQNEIIKILKKEELL